MATVYTDCTHRSSCFLRVDLRVECLQLPAGLTNKTKKNRKIVHFRFDAELNGLLEAACDYLGVTKTDLVESCIRLNLDKVVRSEELRKSNASKLFKKMRGKAEF